jgi:hypothetical protein
MRKSISRDNDVMPSPKKSSGEVLFQTGANVRVKYGVIDPDFLDIPLDGWTGTVTEVDHTNAQITYEITWDKKTLSGMHPVYRKRCERDGLALETMWLGEETHQWTRRSCSATSPGSRQRATLTRVNSP